MVDKSIFLEKSDLLAPGKSYFEPENDKFLCVKFKNNGIPIARSILGVPEVFAEVNQKRKNSRLKV